MIKGFSFFFAFFLLLIIIPTKLVLAENLFIVEVQISGDQANNDFIKIYNPGNSLIDISGYKLKKRNSGSGESSIRVFPEKSQIQPKAYFIWANSKENFHFIIGANVWSTATLAANNSIALLNSKNQILDELAWGESQNPFVKGMPFPINPAANQQLKRKRTNENYQNTNDNSQDFYLYPQNEPELKQITNPETKNETKLEESEHNKTEFNLYPSGVLINEILPYAQEKDETNEWIEIFNQNNFEVDISGWKIKDKAGKINLYIFTQGTKIKEKGFLVLPRSTTKITLNNDADGLDLIQPNEKIIDSIFYEKAPKGQSYNRINNGWFWSISLTPGSTNIISNETKNEEKKITKPNIITTTKPKDSTTKTQELSEPSPVGKIDINTASPKDLQKLSGIGPVLSQRIINSRPFYSLDDLSKVNGIGPKTIDEIKKQELVWIDPKIADQKNKEKKYEIETNLAAISEAFPKQKNPWRLFVGALILAIFFGILVIILKKKLIFS